MEEKCPKCGSPVVMVETKSGKKMKKCSTNTWNKETKQAEGCDFVEWQNGSTEQLDEECPTCGEKLVLYTTANGKRMKKCSTAGWDKLKRVPTGCTYVEWLKAESSAPPAASQNAPLDGDVPPDPTDIF